MTIDELKYRRYRDYFYYNRAWWDIHLPKLEKNTT
jgi:hypothetical protein